MARLRAFRWSDLDGLLAIHNAEADLQAGQVPATRAGLEATWRSRGVSAERDLWVAMAGERIVGYGGLRPWPGAGWLQAEVVVHPDWQGEGLGQALLQRLVREARRRDVDNLAAVAPNGPAGGDEFLRQQGFEVHVPRQHMRLRPIVLPPERPVAGYQVRLSGAEESALLADISNAAYGTEGRIGPADAAGYRRYLRESGTRVWAAERLPEARLVGLCEMREKETVIDGQPVPSGHIGSLAVHPAFQGQGLGRWLLTIGIGDCLRLGWPSVELNVDCDNVPALRLYEGAGFRPVYRYTIYRLAV